MDRATILSWVKPGLTVLNAVSLCTIAVSATVYLTEVYWPGPGEPQRIAAAGDQASPNPRLPRARPDEPVSTGSIRPASAHARMAAAPDIEAPVQPPHDLLQAYIGEHAAIRTCEDKVRNGLAKPGSLNRIFTTTDVYRASGDGTVVTFDFDALNGLGFPLKMQVQCVLDHSRIARLEVLPRNAAR